MRYNNQLVSNGTINDVGEPLRLNVDNSYRLGIENELSWFINKKINLNFNINFSKNIVNSFIHYIPQYDANSVFIGYDKTRFNNTEIAFSPKLTGAYNLTYYMYDNVYVSVMGKYVSDQYIDNTQDTFKQLKSFYTQNISVSYTNISLHKFGKIYIQLFLNNILNNVYEPNAYVYEGIFYNDLYQRIYYYPMAGLNWNCNVKWQWR